MIRKPQNWARADISRDNSKSSAYAHGFTDGWDAALAAVRSKIGPDGLIDQHAIIEGGFPPTPAPIHTIHALKEND